MANWTVEPMASKVRSITLASNELDKAHPYLKDEDHWRINGLFFDQFKIDNPCTYRYENIELQFEYLASQLLLLAKQPKNVVIDLLNEEQKHRSVRTDLAKIFTNSVKVKQLQRREN